MPTDKIEKVKAITKKLKPEAPGLEPNQDHFEALMRQRSTKVEPTANEQQNVAAKEVANTEQVTKVENTLFDEVRRLNQKVENVSRTASPQDLVVQADDVVSQIGSLKDKLETPNLDIKSSVQTLLRSKLDHIDDNLKIVMDKAGLEYTPPEKATSFAKPIDRFLGMLTHAQSQLETISSDVKILAESKQELSPANMLLIQIKVASIQQEIELFTSMLNKALESTKTIMNVQV